jgi:hypothetical protein
MITVFHEVKANRKAARHILNEGWSRVGTGPGADSQKTAKQSQLDKAHFFITPAESVETHHSRMQNKETKENYLALAADYHGKVRNQDADSRTAYSDHGLNVFAAGVFFT